MPQAIPFIIPAVVGAAGIAGSALQASAAAEKEDERFNRLHPAKTPEQLSNMESLRERVSNSMGAEPTAQNNPFAQAAQQGMDRLSQVREKLAQLQQANTNRVAGGANYSAVPRNPFMG